MDIQKNFIIKSHEVHIWIAYLPNYEPSISYFTSILSLDEQKKAKNFRFLKDQNQCIISRGVLRCILSKYLNCYPQNIDIIYGFWGKPALLPYNSMHFNLSHSKDYVLCAIAQGYEVGIDIEYIEKGLLREDEMLSILPENERIDWRELSFESKVSNFFKYWVSREAFLKAHGKGWLVKEDEMSHIAIHSHSTNSEKYPSSMLTYPSYFELIPGYASALFVLGPSLQPIYHICDQTLMNLKL